MEFEYRQADIASLGRILEIYTAAQRFMESAGNPQWGKGFPNKTDITGGILGGILYTVACEGNIAAVFSAVNYDGDYEEIEGHWLTKNNYLAVHRVAVAEEYRGKGAAKFIIGAAAELARARGRVSLRFDTHEKNAPMLGLLRNHGFTECGTITLGRDGTRRIAFEKLI